MFWISLRAQKVQGPAALTFPKNSLSDLDASQHFGSTILETVRGKQDISGSQSAVPAPVPTTSLGTLLEHAHP